MAGTRTAPDVTLAATYKAVSFRWMDWTNDLRSDTYKVLSTATAIELEALGDALQAASNATLYEVRISDVFASVPDSNNASEEVWENVKDNLVFQAKNPVGESERIFIPSPNHVLFIDTTDTIDPTSGLIAAIFVAWTAVIDPAFDVVGARLTSRRDINQQVKI